MNINRPSINLSYEKLGSPPALYLRIRISFKREQRRYSLPEKSPIILSEKDFEKLIKYHQSGSGRASEETRHLYARIKPHLEKAQRVADSIDPFSFSEFKAKFFGAEEKPVGLNFIEALRRQAELMDKTGHVGNADLFVSASTSLQRFIEDFGPEEYKDFLGIEGKVKEAPILEFKHITQKFLTAYEEWMLQYGKMSQKKGEPPGPASITTVGIYARQFRTVFNMAISDPKSQVSVESYPFGKKKYTIPAGKSTKKALSKEDVLKIIAHSCEPGIEQRARDLWVFSYLSNGMNMADICQLRWSHLQNGKITFIRKKTTRSQRGNQEEVIASLFPESLLIIERWGNVDKKPTAHVFPFLEDGQTERRQKELIRQVVKLTNKYMNRIAKEIGVHGNVNTYEARHSFATILLQSEAPVAFISQALGHRSLKTTESYLGSFGDEKTRKYLEALL